MSSLFDKSRGSHSNRGSAIITVIVAMLFVVSLGSALLYVTYTDYKISVTQRADKGNFYSGGAVMSDIKAGIQNAATAAIATAYTSTVKQYANPKNGSPQTIFANEFVKQLSLNQIFITPTTPSGTVPISAYNTAALSGFLSGSSGAVITLGSDNGDNAQYGTVVEAKTDGTPVSITLKSISVKYTKAGYESDISTDITINVPQFYSKAPMSEGLNNCAVVADGGIVNYSGGVSTITGDIFTSGITVTGNGNKLNFSGGNVVCKGDISVNNGASLSFNAQSNELWAHEIDVGTQDASTSTTGAVSLNGKVYVANDLNLSGNGTAKGTGSSATLAGTYIGFGCSTSDSGSSSAILINGRNAKLDISGLSKLSLEGVSFINVSDQKLTTDGKTQSSAIPMGQSLAVKSDQLAYLVPAECISNYATNPCIFSGTVTAPNCDTSTVIWKSNKLSDYIGGGKGSIKTLYTSIDSQGTNIAYVFLTFTSQTYANAYFQDYFSNNPDKISQYLQVYADITGSSSSSHTFDNAGSIYYNNPALASISASSTKWTDGAIKNIYDSKLSPLNNNSNCVVNWDKLNALSANTELDFMKNGSVVAIVTNKPTYTIPSPVANSPQLIITTGDVTLGAAINGVLLVSGKLTLSSGASITAADISSITGLTCGVHTLSEFLSGNAGSGTTTALGDSWDLSSLVVYNNWKTK